MWQKQQLCSIKKVFYKKSFIVFPGLYIVDIGWTVLEKRFILTRAFIFFYVILSKIRTGSTLQECRCSDARNKLSRIPPFTRPLYVLTCQFVKNKKERHYFYRKQAKKTKEHFSIFSRIHCFASTLLFSSEQLFFCSKRCSLENAPESQTKTHLIKLFFTKQLPVAAFWVILISD